MAYDKRPEDEESESNPLLQGGSTRVKENIADFKELDEDKRIYVQLKKHADEGLIDLANMQQNLNDGSAA